MYIVLYSFSTSLSLSLSSLILLFPFPFLSLPQQKCAKLLWFMFLKYVFYHQLEAYNKIDTMELPCNRSSTGHYLSYDKLIKLTKQVKKNKSYNKRKEKEREEEEEESDEDNEDLLNDANKLEEMLEKSHQISIIRHAYISKRTLILLLYLSLLYSGKYIIINDFLKLVSFG